MGLPREFWERYMMIHGVAVTSLHPYKILNQQAIRLALPGITGGKVHVLDLGCGIGELARSACNALIPGSTIHAVDWLEMPIAYARKMSVGLPISYTVHDINRGIGLFERADVVFMMNVLYNIPDWKRALEEIAQILLPGGRLVLANIINPKPELIFAAHQEWLRSATPEEREADAQLAWAREEMVEANRRIAQSGSSISICSVDELTKVLERIGMQIENMDPKAYAGTDVLLCARKET